MITENQSSNFGFHLCGRCGGLIASALDSGESGPGLSPSRGHCVVFLGKTLYSHSASPPIQVYKWVPANLMLGVTLRWTSIPSRGKKKYSLLLHAKEIRDKRRPSWPLGSYADFKFQSLKYS